MEKFNVVFDSKNINFVKVTKYLIDDYLKMVNNPDVSKYISLKQRFFTYDDELKRIKEKLESNSIIFSMIEKSTNEFVGNLEIMNIENNIAEFAICITPEKQGKKYGKESIKRFVEYCFEEIKLDGVELSVYSHNQKAINCYKKLGFAQYKIENNVGKYNGLSIDDIYMKLDND